MSVLLYDTGLNEAFDDKQLSRLFESPGEYLKTPEIPVLHNKFYGAKRSMKPEHVHDDDTTPQRKFGNDAVIMDDPKTMRSDGSTVMWSDGSYDDMKKSLERQGEQQSLPVQFLEPKPFKAETETLTDLLKTEIEQKARQQELERRELLETYGLSQEEVDKAMSKLKIRDGLQKLSNQKHSGLVKESALERAIQGLTSSTRKEKSKANKGLGLLVSDLPEQKAMELREYLATLDLKTIPGLRLSTTGRAGIDASNDAILAVSQRMQRLGIDMPPMLTNIKQLQTFLKELKASLQ